MPNEVFFVSNQRVGLATEEVGKWIFTDFVVVFYVSLSLSLTPAICQTFVGKSLPVECAPELL